jgi:quercetin dioxygenase-like cupin family protein
MKAIAKTLAFLALTGAASLSPAPLHAEELNSPTYSNSQVVPWDDLSNTKGRNWSEAASDKAEQLKRFAPAVRLKRVFYSEDFRLGYIMLAPGAIYPAHVHPAPEVYHMLSGTAEWNVNGNTKIVGIGETIHMKPHASHRIRVVSEEPMKAIWAQWAPGGDQSYMDRGYELLEDLPPLPDSARFGEDAEFFPLTE